MRGDGGVSGRALVLGGGGSSGNAWLIGVVAGLLESGLDVRTADLTVGTSAGSTTAGQIAGANPAELFTATVAASPPPSPGPGGFDQARGTSRPVNDHLERLKAIIAEASDGADMRRRVGVAALGNEASSDEAWQARWRATVAARLPSQQWPERRLLITAVDADSGEPTVFDRESGVDLVDAVAASCAGGGFAYRIGGRPYIDGGYRSNPDNADLAVGHEWVLVLSPLGGQSLFPEEWGLRLAAQVDVLRAGSSRVEVVVPVSDSEHLFGANAMDLSLRAPAARAGYDQARALAGKFTAFWR